MWRRICLCCLLLITLACPATGEINISASTSLDSFNYDLDNLHLKLEKLETRWQLSPTGSSRMAIEHLRAQRLTITLPGNRKKTGKTELPERIKIPITISIQQAEISEIIVLSSTERFVMRNMQFSLNADSKSLNINLQQLETPYGNAKAKLDFGTSKPFPLSGALSLQQTQAVLPYNLNLRLSGDLHRLQFNTENSSWRKQILAASGSLGFEGTQLQNLSLQMLVANNQLQINGKPSDHLDWQANFENLAAIHPAYAGKINARGNLQGKQDNLALQFTVEGKRLDLAHAFSIESLSGQGVIEAGNTGKVQGDLSIQGLQYGKNKLAESRITLQGTRDNHQLHWQAKNAGFTLDSSLQGGLQNDQWQGSLQKLSLQGSSSIHLNAPASLLVSRHQFRLEKANLVIGQGRASLETLLIEKTGFHSSGQLQKMALADLPSTLFDLPADVQGNPVFSGQWNITSDKTLNGQINLQLESGDLSVLQGGKLNSLGLNTAHLDIQISQNRVQLAASLAGDRLGTLDAKFAITLTKTDSGYLLLRNAPLTLNANAQLQSLAWLPLPASMLDASADGQISLTVNGNGTLEAPNLQGKVNGKNLQLILPAQGLTLKDGVLDAAFTDKRLLIHQAIWHSGEGYMSTSGEITLTDKLPYLVLDWKAEQFTTISRSDRLLVMSGTGKTTIANDLLTISGDFIVDRGSVELVDENTPTLGDDVVVIGRGENTPQPSLKILLERLRVDLGKQFKLRGRGLDAELSGSLTMTGLTQHRPHTLGTIQVSKGTVSAYGQTLGIERGILNFYGPLDNPGLNIRAMRGSKPINAGVEVSGNAQLPTVKLVSDPNVPETEKLAWLMLGHGLEKTGKKDLALLSLAAGALLSQGQSVPMQTKLARMAGLDEFGVSGSDPQSTVLTFGKRLTSQLYLSYEKSISGLQDVARLTYDITPKWSLRAEAGSESAVDVLYTFSFK